jgi:hypothetical protein
MRCGTGRVWRNGLVDRTDRRRGAMRVWRR